MTGSTDTSDSIRFILDGEVIELHDVEPTRTVLQYLREDRVRTGTKEGCAEGDCGACTVVVVEIDRSGAGLSLRAINSCIQFLPTLDGKELITVESLAPAGASLHPVQRAMVDHHGSQCGFCTPGFVMSLFALYKSNPDPTRTEIDDALAGNLCRCTGYRPIIAAAKAMYAEGAVADDWLRQPAGADGSTQDRVQRLQSIARKKSLAVRTKGRAFYAPTTAAEFAALAAATPSATILAGGTDIGLWVTKQHRELETVIYTGRVEELLGIDVTSSHIEIGAAVSLAEAVAILDQHYPGLEELWRRFASPPIRNAGTLGGNIANGSPIGDSMPALMAVGTSLVLRSEAGKREVALEDFYHDYQVKDLQEGEFLQLIRVPLPGENAILRSHKLSKRLDQDISAVCTAYYLQRDGDRVTTFRMACGGLAATVKRAAHAEAEISGHDWTEAVISRAAAALAKDFSPITDMRASADYRLEGARNLLRRFYLETSGELDATVYTYGREG